MVPKCRIRPVGTLQTGYHRAQDLSPASRHQTLNPAGEGSSAAACPRSSRPTPGARELWHRHVPLAPSTPPVRKGLRCHHVTRDSKPASRYEGLQHHHVPRGTELATRQRRAPKSSRISRLQTHPLRRKALMSPHVRGTRTTARQGFGITMCPVAPEPPPGAGGL
jgi:hypothetical protein